MNLLRDVSLAQYSTMGLGGNASYVVSIDNRDDLIEALNYASQNKLDILMIGGGSNIVWRDGGFAGLLLVNNVRGFDVENENDEGADILIGAGENWDLAIDRAVSLGLSGIECLSLVPGSAGATPVQNVGAYGQEVSETLVSLEAYDNHNKTFLTMENKDCDFSYRNSCFKKEPGRYFILSPKNIRQAVINIRQAKLPDPAVVHNCGSFFKNPIVSKDKYKELISRFPDIPAWETQDDQMKISAAWLIEQAGFRAYFDSETGMATWEKQALVLVNRSAKNTQDLLNFRDKIIHATNEIFGIELVQEPQLLP